MERVALNYINNSKALYTSSFQSYVLQSIILLWLRAVFDFRNLFYFNFLDTKKVSKLKSNSKLFPIWKDLNAFAGDRPIKIQVEWILRCAIFCRVSFSCSKHALSLLLLGPRAEVYFWVQGLKLYYPCLQGVECVNLLSNISNYL